MGGPVFIVACQHLHGYPRVGPELGQFGLVPLGLHVHSVGEVSHSRENQNNSDIAGTKNK